jgi:hypothetical protein
VDKRDRAAPGAVGLLIGGLRVEKSRRAAPQYYPEGSTRLESTARALRERFRRRIRHPSSHDSHLKPGSPWALGSPKKLAPCMSAVFDYGVHIFTNSGNSNMCLHLVYLRSVLNSLTFSISQRESTAARGTEETEQSAMSAKGNL